MPLRLNDLTTMELKEAGSAIYGLKMFCLFLFLILFNNFCSNPIRGVGFDDQRFDYFILEECLDLRLVWVFDQTFIDFKIKQSFLLFPNLQFLFFY